jgi:CPA2 family monovalent cation:H+ antiporter-2
VVTFFVPLTTRGSTEGFVGGSKTDLFCGTSAWSLGCLFFVTVGALIDLKAITSHPVLLSIVIAMIVVGKFLIWTAVVRLFRYPLRTAVTVAVGLTQIGEFSYVLIQGARSAGLVENDVYNAVLAASLISILLNAFAVRFVSRWIDREAIVC